MLCPYCPIFPEARDTTPQQRGSRTYVVRQPDLHSVPRQLVSVGGRHDVVSFDLGVGNLGNDVLVGAANHQAVLGGIVLVLVLDDQAVRRGVAGKGKIIIKSTRYILAQDKTAIDDDHLPSPSK